ncbi:MAG: hypothetical protein KC593_06260 [Myxococcales bacterium]|nr:hypothetical protein [Myxococcales bacterium]MCB9629271.1 hypothetical protein [Sandaracinaceae bacterium]
MQSRLSRTRRPIPLCALALAMPLFGAGCGGDSLGNADSGSQPPDGDTTRRDAGQPDDAGTGVDRTASCAARGTTLPARGGATIRVSPSSGGLVRVNGQDRTLRQVVSSAQEGDSIVLADGTYTFPEAGSGSYTGLYFTTPNVTMRGESGDPSAVILDSAYGDHGDTTAPITVAASGVVLTGFTVQRSVFHLIHLWEAADDVVLHDLRLLDGGQQFLKGSPGSGTNDRVEVSCSAFIMTASGRDNVWGYGAQDGGTTCYTGGIDSHGGRDWHVHDNHFQGIYCDATGVQRPAHGRAAGERDGMTYNGGLSEHAIHMWDSPSGSGHTLERNRIVDCARGIGLGLRDPVYGGVIRNNMIFSSFSGSAEHDVGIIVERGQDTLVANNTVFFTAPDSYANAVEYRWDTSAGLRVLNNLSNRRIVSRNGASATLGGNVESLEASALRNAPGADLHLASCATAGVSGAGVSVAEVTDDVDGEPRVGAVDVGADQCLP